MLILTVKWALIILGAFFFILTLFLLGTSNFNLGLVLGFLFSAVLFTVGFFLEPILKYSQNGAARWIFYIVLPLLIFFVSVVVFIFCYGQNDTASFNEDAVIVLGAAVHGEVPSNILARRLNKAVEYYEKNPDCVIVVSGGQGSGEDITEAQAMETYLLRKGIPAHKIFKEDKATSTQENFEFSKTILDEKLGENYSCVYITNDFHAYRAGVYAKKCGLIAHRYSANILWNTMHVNYLREFLAVLKMWVLD